MENENDYTVELEKKISMLEDGSYEFPKRFQKKDYIFAAGVALVCLLGVILGGFIK